MLGSFFFAVLGLLAATWVWTGRGRPHRENGESKCEKLDKADGTDRPWEADGGIVLQGAKNNGEEHTTDSAATSSEAIGQGQAGIEPHAWQTNGQNCQASGPHPDADALGEQQLPELGAGALEHGASHDKKASCHQEGTEVAHVEERAGDETQEDHQEGLHGADGGDDGARAVD